MKTIFGLICWQLCVRYLPKSTFPVFGKVFKKLRYAVVKLIFKKVGKNVNVENLAYFGNGKAIEIGDNSGIGKKCRVPSNIRIGKNVMMAEEVIIFNQNHKFDDLSKPMCEQGLSGKTQLSIENDVWIGARVLILPQVTKIGSGVVIAAGAVVTKNIEPFSIVGGNPAKVIKMRN